MKKFLFSAAVLFAFSLSMIVFQISCNKSSVAQRPSDCVGPQPKLQFVANGVTYNCDAIYKEGLGWVKAPYINTGAVFGAGGFTLVASSTKGYDDGMYIFSNLQHTAHLSLYKNAQIAANSSYTIQNGHNVALYNNGTLVARAENNTTTSISLTITSIVNGYASGTFSGQTDSNDPRLPRINISEGTFSNIPVF